MEEIKNYILSIGGYADVHPGRVHYGFSKLTDYAQIEGTDEWTTESSYIHYEKYYSEIYTGYGKEPKYSEDFRIVLSMGRHIPGDETYTLTEFKKTYPVNKEITLDDLKALINTLEIL